MAHRYVLACVVFIFCRVDGESLYGLKGLSVSLKPVIPGKPMDILWKYNGNKLVEFNGKEEHVYGKFKNRITLDWHTAEINITDLRFEDSGNYELEVAINNMFHPSSKTLVVIDTVPEPTISCKMNDSSSSNKSGTLECSAESKDSQTQSLMKLEWESHGNVQPGPQLTISLGNEHDDHVYTCNVSNPMSSKITTFTAKDCYPGKSSSVALAAGLVILFLIIFVVLGIVFCHRTRKACFAVRGDDEEKQSPLAESLHKTTVQVEESKPLLDKAAADQAPNRAVKEMIKMFEGEKGSDRKRNKGKAPPFSPRSEFVKGDADADQLREPAEAAQSEPTDPENANKTGPADEPADLEDKKPHQESFTAPEEPGLETTLSESSLENNKDKHEETGTPLTSPLPVKEMIKMFDGEKDGKMNEDKAPPSSLHSEFDKGDADADQLREPAEAAQSEPTDPENANKTGPADEPADLEDKKPHQESFTAPESELKKEAEKDEEANVPSDSVSPSDKAPSPLTQNSPNVAPENSAGEQSQDMDKPVSTPENEPVTEEIDKEKDLYGDTSQQPQSPIQTKKPNNEHTNTLQESPDTPHKTPDQEKTVKTTQDSDESSEDEDETVQCGPKEEKPDQ